MCPDVLPVGFRSGLEAPDLEKAPNNMLINTPGKALKIILVLLIETFHILIFKIERENDRTIDR